MSTHDKYHLPIENLLKVNGSMGVNAIARELDMPTSSVQKWLERQRYFVKNEKRQWELPDTKNTTTTRQINGELREVIDAQLLTIQRLHRTLADQLEATVDFIKDYELTPPQVIEKEKEATPVADVDPRLIQLQEDAKKLKEIFNKKDIKSNIPDEYKALLNGYDHVGLILKEGKDFATKFLEDEIFSLLSGRIAILSEETVDILKENQK